MITVVILEFTVPFPEYVSSFKTFEDDDTAGATSFINNASHDWWLANNGDLSAKQFGHDSYAPITELGYDVAYIELWDGENGFKAVIDKASQVRLQEAYYKRNYSDKGEPLPGYLQNALGVDTTAAAAEVYDFYKPRN